MIVRTVPPGTAALEPADLTTIQIARASGCLGADSKLSGVSGTVLTSDFVNPLHLLCTDSACHVYYNETIGLYATAAYAEPRAFGQRQQHQQLGHGQAAARSESGSV